MVRNADVQPESLANVIYGVEANLGRLVDFIRAIEEVVRMPEFRVIVNPPSLDDPVAVQNYVLACLKVSQLVVAKTPNTIDDAVWQAAIAAVQSDAFPVIYKLIRGMLDGGDNDYRVTASVFVSPNIILIIQLALMIVRLIKQISNVVEKDVVPIVKSKNNSELQK